MRKLASHPASVVVFPLATLAFFIGCGGEPVPAQPPPTASDTPSAQPAPPPPSSSAATDTPAPSASASAKADATPPKSSGGGTPAVIKEDDVEITDTFGSRPAKIVIAQAFTFRIPEGALAQGTNITFKLDPKGKSLGAPIGKIFHVISVIPPSGTPSVVPSNGPPFEVAMPAGNKKDANLAIGKIETDDKGRDKLKWAVIAPKRIDDATGMAYFEITEVSDIFLHITTKAPTEAKK